MHIFQKPPRADVLFLRTRQVGWRAATANNGRRLADEGEEEWAVVAEPEPEQEKEDHQHYDIRPDNVGRPDAVGDQTDCAAENKPFVSEDKE